MAKNVDIYVDRVKVGPISCRNDRTLGQILADAIDLYRKELGAISSGTAIVNDPPSHSDASVLLLGSRFRYLCSFNLAQIIRYRDKKYDSAIQRNGLLVGATSTTIISDISYNNTESIYFFTRLHDWSSAMSKFEELQLQALIQHHNFIKTNDVKYRQQNQQYRRQLMDGLRNFLGKANPSGFRRSICDAKTQNKGQSITSSMPGNCLPSPLSSTDCPASGGVACPHPPLPTAGTSRPVQSPRRKIPLDSPRDSFTTEQSETKLTDTGDRFTPHCHRTSHSFLNTLMDPNRAMPAVSSDDQAASTSSSGPSSTRIIYKSQEREPGNSYLQDFAVALELHRKLNPGQDDSLQEIIRSSGSDIIKRLVEAGIAVDPFTGQ